MKAMILAAGRGERMRPLTDNMPKPLLEVQGKPLIVHHIERLKAHGFTEIVINLGHLGYMIPEALGDGSQWGVRITYSDEQESGALESLGGIVKALPHLGEEFLVVNGDVWCDYAFDSSFTLGAKNAHLILVPNPEHNEKGDFEYKQQMYTFSGIGYYQASMFDGLVSHKAPLAPLLRKNIANGTISFEIHSGVWRDIGTPQRLEEINQ